MTSAIRSQDKSAATRIGVSVEFYVSQCNAGMAWCSMCRSFKSRAEVSERECRACTVARSAIKRAKCAAKRREME